MINTGRLVKILIYLSANPKSSARTITSNAKLGRDDRLTYQLLEHAELDGYVQRSRTGSSAWLWEICPKGRAVIGETGATS